MLLPGGGSGYVVAAPTVSNCALNFVVPAYFCKVGSMQATVRLWPLLDGPMSGVRATESAQLWFLSVPAPKVCLVRVNWTDSAGNISRPTDAAMLATLGLGSRMLPLPACLRINTAQTRPTEVAADDTRRVPGEPALTA